MFLMSIEANEITSNVYKKIPSIIHTVIQILDKKAF